MSSVVEIDVLAEQMFASPDGALRQQAHDRLIQLTTEGADSSTFFSVFQQSDSQYALLFATQGVVKWFKANQKWFSEEQRRQLVIGCCGDCLKRLVLSDAPRHVTMSVISAYTKLTKLSFETEPFLTEAAQFGVQLLQQGGDQKTLFLGLLLLSGLASEMSKHNSSRTHTFMNFATHRRCSNNFRDECLLTIFNAAVAVLEGVTPGSPYVGEIIELVKDCLTYDFMAISVDETEEALSSQFPTSWRETIFSDHTRRVLWGQHAALPYPYCATLLTGLTALCGIRRTFFETAEERQQYVDSILGLLVETAGMADGRLKVPHYISVYTEACLRLLLAFGYRDLHLSTHFARWIEMVGAISADIFTIPFGQEGSFTTATLLLTFWERLTISRRNYADDEQEKGFELFAPELAMKFVLSRVTPSGGGASEAQGFSADDADMYNGVMEAVLAQSQSLANMILVSPTTILRMLADYLEQGVGPQILNRPVSVAWLFFIVGYTVTYVLPHIDSDAVEASSRVLLFCTDCASHRRHRSAAAEGDSATGGGDGITLMGNMVERALLHFLTSMQGTMTAARLHADLSLVVTNVFQSRALLFQFILNHTGQNMVRSVSGSDAQETVGIMRTSIDLIGDACRDVSPAILAELTFDLPPVVDLPLAQASISYRLRTNLFRVMWPLTNKGPYTHATMMRFLNPIQRCIQTTLSGSGSSPIYIAGWMRDLRGVSAALAEHSEAFADFVEWFCDQAVSFHTIIQQVGQGPTMVVISFMRFLCELVESRGGRCALPSAYHSSCGLILFKHLSAFIQQVVELCITEDRIRGVTENKVLDGAYEMMLKPLSLSMMCLKRCVQGGFVPFGAILYYNDDTFHTTLLGLLRMLIVFPTQLFKEYPKVTYAVVDLLRTITEEQTIHPFGNLSSSELDAIISFVIYVCSDMETLNGTLLHGMSFLGFIAGLIKEVTALQVSPALTCSDAVGRGGGNTSGTPPLSLMQLPSYYSAPGTGRVSGTPTGRSANQRSSTRSTRQAREALARLLEPLPHLWRRLISVAMNVIVLQDRALGVSCAVVFPIFEAYPPFWYDFVENFVGTYPIRKQEAVREALSTLSNASESQERFFSEVFSFRQRMRSL